MRSASGAALTFVSNFKPIDIFEYAEPGEPKGMGRWPGELADQPHLRNQLFLGSVFPPVGGHYILLTPLNPQQ